MQPLLLLLAAHALFAVGCASTAFSRSQNPASSPSSIAEEAATAYARQDWRTAIINYEELRERGIHDPALFYNLGTAYAKSGESGRAALMLIRALRLAPRDPDIRANIEILSPETLNQLAVFPVPPIEFVYGLFSMNEWAFAALGATLLAALAWGAYFWTPKSRSYRAALRRAGFWLAVLAACLHGFAGAKYYQEAYTSRGVIIAAETHPREAPSESAPAAEFILPPGTIIKVENAGVPGWVKAIYGGRNQVFVRREQMEFL
jgi:tetratricopeptide (TPR) repeat protein